MRKKMQHYPLLPRSIFLTPGACCVTWWCSIFLLLSSFQIFGSFCFVDRGFGGSRCAAGATRPTGGRYFFLRHVHRRSRTEAGSASFRWFFFGSFPIFFPSFDPARYSIRPLHETILWGFHPTFTGIPCYPNLGSPSLTDRLTFWVLIGFYKVLLDFFLNNTR